MSCCESIANTPDGWATANTDSEKQLVSFDIVALILSGFIAGNTTVATLAINLSDTDPGFRNWFQAALSLSCFIVALLLSPQILRNAASNLARRRVSVDLLFAMGAVGSLAFSCINFVRGEGPVYFEVFNVLLVIYSVGSLVKRKAQVNVLKSIEGWSTDADCQIVDADGTLQRCRVRFVKKGDRVVVAAGKAIPVDGKVVRGKAFVRESVVTGEPHLRSVSPGDVVHAASLATDAALEIEATSSGDDRSVDQIQRSLHDTISSTSRWQSSADRVSRWFTPAVAIISLLTFAYWTVYEGPEFGTMAALAVMLVACPCAFGFATPVAVWVCASRLASIGWRAGTGEAMEKLAEVDTVVFDKTGTLTVMQPTLARLIVRKDSLFTRKTLLAVASSLQSQTAHPFASVFTGISATHLTVCKSEPIPGVGIRGTVAVGGKTLAVEIGRLEDLHRPCCDADLLDRWHETAPAGSYPVAIRIDTQLEAIAVIDEQPVDSLQDGLEYLRNLDLTTHVYSGDQAERVARLGIESFEGSLSPNDKAERVRTLTEGGHRVLFVGDGINDVLAMGQSHVSAAVNGGVDLASSIADFQWQSHELKTVAEAISISRRSMRRLQRTLLFSLSYNTVGMLVAATGFLHPVIAVLLMMSASLTVVLRAADVSHDSFDAICYRPAESLTQTNRESNTRVVQLAGSS